MPSLINIASIKAKHPAKLLVYAFVLCCLWSASSQATEANPSYPDIWYRTYEWPVEVREILFADPAKWQDEPVVILGKDKARNVVAEGFFSKKRYALTGVYKKGEWHYRYKRDGKPLVKRYMNGKSDKWLGALPNDEKLDESYEYFLSGGGIDQYSRPKDGLPAAVADWTCEPVKIYLEKKDPAGKVIWSRAIVRYYSAGEHAVNHFDVRRCLDYRYWLTNGFYGTVYGGDGTLLLGDGTALIIGGAPFTYVVRIRLEDGKPLHLPPNIKVFDQSEVIEAKLKLLKQYKQELDSKGWELTDFWIKGLKTPEQVSRDLAAYLF